MENYRGITGPWKVAKIDEAIVIDTDWPGEEAQVENFITIWGDNASYIKTAKLIAAAPELLEALIELVAVLPSVTPIHQDARVKACKAINKALTL